jgi:hypothetical protein
MVLAVAGRFPCRRKSFFGCPISPLPNCNNTAQSFRDSEIEIAI